MGAAGCAVESLKKFHLTLTTTTRVVAHPRHAVNALAAYFAPFATTR